MRYILGVLVALGMIAVIFFFIFRGGSGGSQQPTRIDLNNYANTDASVQLIVDGNVQANQEHRAYRIDVNRTATTMQVYQGYEQNVTAARTTPNNQVAYTAFIRSLSKLNFTAVDATKPTDERGYCPTGQRFILRIVQGDREIYRAWTSSCGKSIGNFQGDSSTIRVLFREQVPEYNTLISGTSLS